MVWDHIFRVPLDWSRDSQTGPMITIFAREVLAPNKSYNQLPYLLYLQGVPSTRPRHIERRFLGGPGFAANLPIDGGSWLKTATNYFRVVLLDQRGTGRLSSSS